MSRLEHCVFALFGDHDSELLSILNILSATGRLNQFRLFFRFLDYVDFDHTTLVDFVLNDTEPFLTYFGSLVTAITNDEMALNRAAEDLQESDDETDYIASGLETLRDVYSVLSSTGFKANIDQRFHASLDAMLGTLSAYVSN
ncbi:hypothetical protein HDV03_001893 [Kappamyces sp. JEL0829]|nr:hypothetical protein HDV03_001893 [Kappamyces sp. JEL0829]